MLLTKKTSFKEYVYKELEWASSFLSFNVKNYLADLLCFYLSSDRFFEKREGQIKSYEYILTDLYSKSQTSKFQEKLYLFKKMGDFSLYFSGFFRSAAKKKIVHISYYEQMGQSAYSFISKTYGSKPNVFKELSSEFKELSQILFSIQKKSERQNSKYCLKASKKTVSETFNQRPLDKKH